MARDATIRYIGDSSSAERASRRVATANGRMQRTFSPLHKAVGRLQKAMLLGAAAGGVLAVKFGVDAVKAFEEANKVSKQTEAVLTSTNHVVGIQAKYVEKLAQTLSMKAGIDDELIQSGENVLLTFTKIRNEVGKGNNVFERATTVALDMSVALGTDLQGSIIQVGKALNDPIKGITALQRVGVSFSEKQKETIRRLVETGDTLGAQKVILAELTKEFGGSAAAQATASGKMSVAWGNVQEAIGEKLAPVLEAFSTWVTKTGIPAIEDLTEWIEGELVPAFQDVARWVGDNVVPPLETMGRVITETVVPALADAVEWIDKHIGPAFERLQDWVDGTNERTQQGSSNWKGWAVAAGVAAVGIGVAAAGIAAAVAGIMPALKAVGVAFGAVGFAGTMAWLLIQRTLPFAAIATLAFAFRDQLLDAIGAAWRGIKGFFVEGAAYVRRKWDEFWAQLRATLSDWWTAVSDWFKKLPGRIVGFFAKARDWLVDAGGNIIGGLKDGMINAVKRIPSFIAGIGKDIIDAFWDWIKPGSPSKATEPMGRNLIEGLVKGLLTSAGRLPWVFKKLGKGWLSALGGVVGGLGNVLFGDIVSGESARSNQMLGRQLAQSFGWSGSQWDALNKLVMSESGWSNTAQNPTSSAYGIGQFLDSTWGSVGYSKTSNPTDQIMAMMAYIRQRYGDPTAAWAFKQTHNWYGSGGVIPGPPGAATVIGAHGGEGIFTPGQMRSLTPVGRGTVNININNPVIANEAEFRAMVRRAVNYELGMGNINKRGRVL